MRSAELAVLVAAALVFLAGLGARDLWEPDEPRHAAIAAEMRTLDHGPAQLVLPRLNGEPYTQKPPLYYWLAAAAGGLGGSLSEGAARLPSALAALLTTLVVYQLGRSSLGRAAGLAAAGILVTLPSYVDVARSARPDALLALSVTTSLWLAWRLDRGLGSAAWNRRALHLAMGLGLLTKGPVAALLPMLGYAMYLAWERRPGALAQLFSRGSWLLSAGLALAWLAAAVWLAPAGFFHEAITENLLGRYFAGASHEQPLHFYVKRLPVAFLPWALLWPLAIGPIRRGLAAGADPERRRALRFLIAFAGASLLFLTLSDGKRVIYLIPLFPALALLSAEVLRGPLAQSLRGRRSAALQLAAAAAALAALLAAAYIASQAGVPAPALALALVAIPLLAALPWERAFPAPPILARGFPVAVAVQVAVFGWLLPRLDGVHSIRATAAAAAAHAPEGTPIGLVRNGALAGGVAYYSGRAVTQVGSEGGLRRFLGEGGRVLILETPHLPAVEGVTSARIVFRQRIDEDEVLVVVPGPARLSASAHVDRLDCGS